MKERLDDTTLSAVDVLITHDPLQLGKLDKIYQQVLKQMMELHQYLSKVRFHLKELARGT